MTALKPICMSLFLFEILLLHVYSIGELTVNQTYDQCFKRFKGFFFVEKHEKMFCCCLVAITNKQLTIPWYDKRPFSTRSQQLFLFFKPSIIPLNCISYVIQKIPIFPFSLFFLFFRFWNYEGCTIASTIPSAIKKMYIALTVWGYSFGFFSPFWH